MRWQYRVIVGAFICGLFGAWYGEYSPLAAGIAAAVCWFAGLVYGAWLMEKQS